MGALHFTVSVLYLFCALMYRALCKKECNDYQAYWSNDD